jgi:hypothetical protein
MTDAQGLHPDIILVGSLLVLAALVLLAMIVWLIQE